MAELRALSLTRPWPDLIFDHGKDVENRSWKPPADLLGEWVVVHAAKSWDRNAAQVAREATGRDVVLDPSTPTGYLGVMLIGGVCDLAVGQDSLFECICSAWAFPGQYHWHVDDVLRFDMPIPGAGRLGLWTPPDAVAEVASELLAVAS